MKKPILATNLDDLLIDHVSFVEPHKAWFDRAIKKTGDKTLSKWKGKKDYFPGVIQAMKQILPDASPQQRTIQARMWYHEDVIRYIKEHSENINQSVASKLRKLKSKYTLALITTTAQNYIGDILEASKLDDIYEIIVASRTDEEPYKPNLVERFIKEHGIPKYYISGKSSDEVIDLLKAKGVKIIGLKDLDKI